MLQCVIRTPLLLRRFVAEIDSNEERTYKILRMPPLGSSYAVSIAQKYGITFDTLTTGKEHIL